MATDDPKVSILHRFHGARALTLAKDLLFPDSPTEADIWASEWTTQDIDIAFLVIYSRFLIRNSVIGFKFSIGKGEKQSVVGEEHEEIKGLRIVREAGLT